MTDLISSEANAEAFLPALLGFHRAKHDFIDYYICYIYSFHHAFGVLFYFYLPIIHILVISKNYNSVIYLTFTINNDIIN